MSPERWSIDKDFYKVLVEKALRRLWDDGQPCVSIPIARPDDEFVWVGNRFLRKFAQLVVWREDWKSKRAAKKDIEMKLREQVAAIDKERGHQ